MKGVKVRIELEKYKTLGFAFGKMQNKTKKKQMLYPIYFHQSKNSESKNRWKAAFKDWWDVILTV